MSNTTSRLKRSLKPDSHGMYIAMNPAQVEIINRLLATGLYGNTAKQVVERLICEAMQKHANANSH